MYWAFSKFGISIKLLPLERTTHRSTVLRVFHIFLTYFTIFSLPHLVNLHVFLHHFFHFEHPCSSPLIPHISSYLHIFSVFLKAYLCSTTPKPLMPGVMEARPGVIEAPRPGVMASGIHASFLKPSKIIWIPKIYTQNVQWCIKLVMVFRIFL